MIMITNKQLVDFAERNVGIGVREISVCFNLSFPEEDFDDLSTEQRAIINSIIFVCGCCGWICGNDEKHSYDGEALCDTCYEDWMI